MTSILVTGGAGFIGNTLVRKLLDLHEVRKITVFDRLQHREGHHHISQQLKDPRVQFIEGDVNSLPDLKALFEKESFSGVFHLAEEINSEPALSEVTTGISGTLNVFRCARYHEVSMLRCSSADVYGSAPFPKKFSESTPLSPSSLSAAVTSSCDQLLNAASADADGKYDLITVRATHCYGAGQDRQQLIPQIIHAALRNEPVRLPGSGRQIRDWMHVEDCALGLIAAFRSGSNRNTYHLGANSERTFLGIARTILKQLKRPENLIQLQEELPEGDEREALDTRRALQILKWKARIPFRTGFENTVRELAAHLRPEEETSQPPAHPR